MNGKEESAQIDRQLERVFSTYVTQPIGEMVDRKIKDTERSWFGGNAKEDWGSDPYLDCLLTEKTQSLARADELTKIKEESAAIAENTEDITEAVRRVERAAEEIRAALRQELERTAAVDDKLGALGEETAAQEDRLMKQLADEKGELESLIREVRQAEEAAEEQSNAAMKAALEEMQCGLSAENAQTKEGLLEALSVQRDVLQKELVLLREEAEARERKHKLYRLIGFGMGAAIIVLEVLSFFL